MHVMRSGKKRPPGLASDRQQKLGRKSMNRSQGTALSGRSIAGALLLAFLFSGLAPFTQAQSTAAFQGTVTDPAGAGVPDASVAAALECNPTPEARHNLGQRVSVGCKTATGPSAGGATQSSFRICQQKPDSFSPSRANTIGVQEDDHRCWFPLQTT